MSVEKKDPWTDPDPQPGDFDEYIAEMGPDDIEVVEPGSTRVVYIGNEDPNEYIRRRRAEEARNGSGRVQTPERQGRNR